MLSKGQKEDLEKLLEETKENKKKAEIIIAKIEKILEIGEVPYGTK